MKFTEILKLPFIALLALMLVFTSCQQEEDEFIDETNTEETISKDSPLTNFIIRSSQNDGDVDDILDGSDCFEIVLPVTVIANGQEVIIEDEDDFDIVEDIFDQFPDDTDTLEFVFPITVELEDYSLIVVNNQAEYDALLLACENDDIEDTIDCIQFVYPITFFTFNLNNEQTGTVTVNSDEELYEFLSNLDSDTLIAIDYPISVIVNGETIQVNNNQELFNILSQANCDDDDDDDNDEDCNLDTTGFTEILTDGVWYVTYFFDDFDETDDFVDYEFAFNPDGSATATIGNDVLEGTWALEEDDDDDDCVDLLLDFGESEPLDELGDDWDIIEFDAEIIRLKDVSGGDGSTDFLTFERTPNDGGSNEDLNQFIENLTTDQWFVDLYLDDEVDDETCDYAGYEFLFNANGTVTAMSDTDAVEGFWSAQMNDGNIELVMNFETTGTDDPFEDLNDDWDVLSFSIEFIEMEDISGGDGSRDVLVFGRNPADGCDGGGGDAQALRDTLTDGVWIVALYLDDGIDETIDFNDYELTFNSNGTVIADNGSNLIDGSWSVVGTTTLDLVLDFGGDIPFDELEDDWDVIEFIDTRVELQDVSGGGGGTDDLVLEKL